MSRTTAARALSIAGHPVLLMPAAVVWAACADEAPPHVVHVAAAASGFVALSVGVYSWLQVRSGRWRHVDASSPHERRQLNVFLSFLLFGAAGFLWWSRQPPSVCLGLAAGSALVVFAHLLRARLKMSLHAAFAVFAASLAWPRPLAVCLALSLAAGVSWSRLALGRHTAAEVILGLLAGGTAGFAFLFALRHG